MTYSIMYSGGHMKVSRKKMDRKVDRRVSGVKRKAVKSHSVIARKPHRVARTSGKRTPQGVKSLKRKAASGQRTTQSKAHETAETVGKFLGEAIGNAERLINKSVETAKGSVS